MNVQVESEELLDDMIKVKSDCLALLDAAEQSICFAEGDSVKIMLNEAWHSELNRCRIVAVGRETVRHGWFWKRSVTTTYYYIRDDYYYTLTKKYSHSKLESWSKESLIAVLSKTGNWGKFMRANQNLLTMIHRKCVDGENSDVQKIDDVAIHFKED